MYIYTYIYIYIYIYIPPPTERFQASAARENDAGLRNRGVWGFGRKEPVRFDSFRFRTFRQFIGLVRFGSDKEISVRRGSACVFRTCRGSVRFSAVRFRVRFRPVPELNGSVRFGSAGSVRFLIPSCYQGSTSSETCIRCATHAGNIEVLPISSA